MLNRRNFLGLTSSLLTGSLLLPDLLWGYDASRPFKDLVIGHGSHRYKIDYDWGLLDSSQYPVKDCHEMVQDSKGRIILLTNETRNNVLIYDKSGKFLESWGHEYPGAHGLTLSKENGEDFLYISDNNRHEVIKTTLKGEVVMTLPFPQESGKYEKADQYIPTEVAVASNGDIYVADGYGMQYIMRYNAKGELLHVFGGRGDGPEHFDNAHGICIDDRDTSNPRLLITARQQNALKHFSLAGEYLSTIELPGAFICRPVIDGENVYGAVLVSKLPFGSESGFVTILDGQNRVISNPGGSTPLYQDNQLQRMHQVVKVFKHPHDVCVDDDKNLYVAQWNSGGVYPIKLVRV